MLCHNYAVTEEFEMSIVGILRTERIELPAEFEEFLSVVFRDRRCVLVVRRFTGHLTVS